MRRLPGRQQPGEVLRHGHQVEQSAEAEGDRHAHSAADQHNNDGLHKELHHDAARLRAHRLAHADLAGAFAHRDQHDVHHAQPAEEQRGKADRAEERFHAVGHGFEGLRLFDRVPDIGRFGVVTIEVVDLGQRADDFVLARGVLPDRLRRHQQAIEPVRLGRRLVGKIVVNGGVRE